MMRIPILLEPDQDELENCRQVYDENYQEWLSMKSRLDELQSQVEAVLEAQARVLRREYYVPPSDRCTHSTLQTHHGVRNETAHGGGL